MLAQRHEKKPAPTHARVGRVSVLPGWERGLREGVAPNPPGADRRRRGLDADQLGCWMPASTQPEAPEAGRVKFQISENGSAGLLGSSRMRPLKSTLATRMGPS